MSSWRAFGLGVLLLAAGLSVPRAAWADDARSQAAALYDRAVIAQEEGDYAAAARLFARADELAPDPAALEAALGATLLADEAALGMTLVERSSRGVVTGTLAKAVRAAQARFADRVGLLRVECGGCTLVVDGEAFPEAEERWVSAGEHGISGLDGAFSGEKRVTVGGGERVTITLELPGRDRAARAERASLGGQEEQDGASGLSTAWFGVGVGLTVLGVGATVVSGLDTLAIHDDFEAEPTVTRAAWGQSAETRTNVLAGLTAGLAVGTALVGLFAVDWGPEEPRVAPLVAPVPGGGAAGLSGRF